LAIYKLNAPIKQMRTGHGLLLIPPLVVSLVFCYAYVIISSNSKNHAISASSAKPNSSPVASGENNLSGQDFSSTHTLDHLSVTAGGDIQPLAAGLPGSSKNSAADLQGAMNSDGQGKDISVGSHNYNSAYYSNLKVSKYHY